MVAFTALLRRHGAPCVAAVASALAALGLMMVAPASADELQGLRDASRALEHPTRHLPSDPDAAQPSAPDRPADVPAKLEPASVPNDSTPNDLAHPLPVEAAAPPLTPPATEPAAKPVVAAVPASVPPASAAAQLAPNVQPTSTASPVDAKPAPASTLPASATEGLVLPTPDYYGERAKKLLESERKSKDMPHPLQLAAPDYDVMVCVAGCMEQGSHVVSKRLKSTTVSAMAPVAAPSAPGSVSGGTGVACIAGCGTPVKGSGKQASASTEGAPLRLGSAAGDWLTTTVSTPNAPAAVPPSQTAAVKPAGKTVSTDDWMARINRDRAQAKAKGGHADHGKACSVK